MQGAQSTVGGAILRQMGRVHMRTVVSKPVNRVLLLIFALSYYLEFLPWFPLMDYNL